MINKLKTLSLPVGVDINGNPVCEEFSVEGVSEAPVDGKQYARKDAAWSEVTATGGSGNAGVVETESSVIAEIDGGTLLSIVSQTGGIYARNVSGNVIIADGRSTGITLPNASFYYLDIWNAEHTSVLSSTKIFQAPGNNQNNVGMVGVTTTDDPDKLLVSTANHQTGYSVISYFTVSTTTLEPAIGNMSSYYNSNVVHNKVTNKYYTANGTTLYEMDIVTLAKTSAVSGLPSNTRRLAITDDGTIVALGLSSGVKVIASDLTVMASSLEAYSIVQAIGNNVFVVPPSSTEFHNLSLMSATGSLYFDASALTSEAIIRSLQPCHNKIIGNFSSTGVDDVYANFSEIQEFEKFYQSKNQESDLRDNADKSTALGKGINIKKLYATAVGEFNEGKADTEFEVGMGSDDANRANGLEVYTDGDVRAPATVVSDAKSLVTREYLEDNMPAPKGNAGVLEASSTIQLPIAEHPLADCGTKFEGQGYYSEVMTLNGDYSVSISVRGNGDTSRIVLNEYANGYDGILTGTTNLSSTYVGIGTSAVTFDDTNIYVYAGYNTSIRVWTKNRTTGALTDLGLVPELSAVYGLYDIVEDHASGRKFAVINPAQYKWGIIELGSDNISVAKTSTFQTDYGFESITIFDGKLYGLEGGLNNLRTFNLDTLELEDTRSTGFTVNYVVAFVKDDIRNIVYLKEDTSTISTYDLIANSRTHAYTHANRMAYYAPDGFILTENVRDSNKRYYVNIASAEYEKYYQSKNMDNDFVDKAQFSTSLGNSIVNNRPYATAVGEFNEGNPGSSFEVGGGTDDANRKNLFDVDAVGAKRATPTIAGALTARYDAATGVLYLRNDGLEA